MFRDALRQLGAPNHESLPQLWVRTIEQMNYERIARHMPLLELRYVGMFVKAYVNRGAWVADCAERDCGGGMAVSPDWPLCACLDCGRIYEVLVPGPVAIAAATVLLERRAVKHQNWYPSQEPIEVLRAENRLHDLSDEVEVRPGDGLCPGDGLEFWLESAVNTVGPALHPGNLNLQLGTGGV